jgi:dihydroneopterin aldolase
MAGVVGSSMQSRVDRILLTGITASGFHGVLAAEQSHGQEFRVDLALELPLLPAATADDLALTVDYDQLATAVTERITGVPVKLIETLAERIALDCLEIPAVAAVEVTLHKPSAPVAARVVDVAVAIRREKNPE